MDNQYIIPIFIILGILVVLIGAYFFGFFSSSSTDSSTDSSTGSSTPPAPTILPLVLSTPSVKLNAALSPSAPSDLNQSPSDLHPFKDLAEAIEPSVLPEAKKDYNKIITKFILVFLFLVLFI